MDQMDQNDLKSRAAGLKARYSEGLFVGRFPGPLEPGAIFPLGNDIFVGDMATHTLRRYSPGTWKVEQSLDLKEYGVDWSCGYDEGSGKIYLVGKQKKELLLMDPKQLQVEERYQVGVENGIFFTWQGNRFFIPGLTSPHTVKILRSGVWETAGIDIESSPQMYDHLPFAFMGEDSIGLYYMDARAVLCLKEGKFPIVHCFRDFLGRLYRVQYLPGSEIFLALSSQPSPRGLYSMIHMYDKKFNFLRTLSFPGCRAAGNFCVAGNHLFLTSRVEKYVAVFEYDPQVFMKWTISDRVTSNKV